MYYSMLVGFVFLSMTVCTDAMKDKPSRENSSHLIRVKLSKRTPSDKVERAASLPKSNNPCLRESEVQNPLYKKNDKCF